MKPYYLIPIIAIMISCKCKKDIKSEITKTDLPKAEITDNSRKTNCPENGKCKIEIFRNKSLDVKTDEFGSIYYDKIDAFETSVIKYSYSKDVPEGLQDASYREEIIFEINNSDKEIKLADIDLQKTKMLFGRFCYCKGFTGNYKVDKGNLELKQTGNEIQFTLNFKVSKTAQVINSITETVK